MKAVLEFDLPDNEVEFKRATNANDYYDALANIANHLRSTRKYRDLTEDQISLIGELEDYFYKVTDGLLNDI